ncbi:MAG: hypothetical protein HYY13_13235, partial [Nitrospirae bacterium]|nr:hypothetical protein [Nitrospirota bacterium]
MSNTISRLFFLTCLTLGMASCQESDRGLDVLARGASPSTHSAPPAPSRSPALTDPIPWNPSLPIPFGVLPQNSQRFDVTQLGVQYLRFELDWSLLQPNCLGGQQPPDCDPEPIDWTAQDAFMDDIEALGLRAFPSIYVGRAQWINGKDPYTHGLVEPQSFPPKDLSDEWAEEYGYSLIYYNFLTELFERYRGRLDYVALENEATNLIYWGGGSCDYPGDPDCDYLAAAQEYVRLVKTAAKAINDTRHDGDPPIRTMDSGIVSGHWGFVIAKEGIDLGLDPPTGYTDWYTWAWDYYTLGIPESSVPEWHSLEELTEALDTPAEDLEVWIETTEILDGLYYDPTREPGQSGPAVHLLNFHYYESYRWIPRVADWIRDRALQTQALAMPVMSNEMGMRGSYDPDQCIPNYFDDVELDRQSREVFKNLAMTRVSDLQGLVWYSIDTTCEEDRTEPDKASLMNYPDSTPRPSGSTFERSVRVLNQDGLTFVETVSAGPQLFQYHYRIGSALDPWPVDLVVAWTEPTDPDGECPPPCVLPITLGSILANPTAVVTDYKGDITHLPVSNNQVTVDISDPVFIRLGYPPASPSALSATPISSSQIDLMWQDTSSGETAFIVERKQDPGPFAEIIELPPDTTAYPDLSRAPSTPYCYRVRASRNGVDSVHSAEACATTLAVYTITATKDGEGDGWVASDPPGLACGDVCSYDFSSGTAVVVTAEPDASSAFDTWGGACASVPRTDPCVLVVDSSKSVQATFKAGFLLSVSAQGGTLAGSPPGILCGTGGVDCSERYVVDTEVQLTATPDDAYGLKAWGGDCASTPPTSSTCDLTISDNLNAWAEFVPKYVLNVGDSDPNDLGGGRVHTVDAFGGHVEGIDCTLGGSGQGDCTQEYLDGSFVYLVAESETGSIFGGWADACAGSGEETGCALVLAGDTAVNATFKLLYHLSVSLEGTGVGRVDIASEGETVTCGPTCALDLPEGTQVTLTATPALNHTFDGWGGDCASEPGVVCDIAMSGARTATATFTPLYTLSVGVGGPGNIKTVDANGVPIDGIHCGTTGGTCWKEYRSGSPVYLKAFPDGHALFSDWAVDCDLTVGDTCTLLMTRDMTANASFKPLHTLAVNPQTQGWNGAGNVLGYYADRTPTGLDCGNGGLVCAMEFPEGTEVALVATPASGSMFSNWSGGCTVNWDGSCTATLSAPTAVDATFKLVFTMTVTQDGDGSGTVSPQPTPLTSVCDQAQCLIEYPELEAVTLTATANP